MDLSQLKFTVDTTELDRAGVAIGSLVANIGKLDKAARDQARAEATLAKAAKDSATANLNNAKAQDVLVKSTLAIKQAEQEAALILERKAILIQQEAKLLASAGATAAKAEKDKAKANLDNAKAEDVRVKSALAVEQAEKKAVEALDKKTKALNDQNNKLSSSEKLLIKTRDAIGYMTDGLSRGQATQTAYLKSLGGTNTQIEEFINLKQLERKLIGKDTFDDSQQGLIKLKNAYTELKESVRQYSTDSNLTSKQTRELARDKERLIESMKAQGASFQDIRRAVRAHNDEYVSLASSYNKMTSAEDAVIKSRKDAVVATNYLTQADQKMAAALNVSNASLDKAGTDSLVRYEAALRKSGVSQEVATQKLATYKMQLNQVAGLEEKRRAQHLARALSPQLTDIGVSLYSGQAPLTVLLQQGGQIADLLRLSGVEAQNFGKALRDAFSSMLPVMATVAKGLGGFAFGLFYDAGKGMTDFISKTIGMNKAIQHTDDLLYLVGGRAIWFSKVIHGATAALAVGFGVGLLGVIAGLASLAVGLKQVITENNDLAKAFALSGASIGLSHAQIIGYVKTLADSGATTGQATEALVAMAKAGTFTSKEILLVSDSAIQMQKGFGVAIEDTIKQFAKLKEKPVEALLEIAKSSGMVGPEIIKMVQELERAGKTTDAASLAMKSYADVNRQRIGEMKEDYNGFALFLVELGQGIKQFFSDSFKALFLSTSPSRQLENQLSSVRDQIKEINTFGSFGRGDELKVLKEQERILQSRISATVRLQGEQDKIKLANVESAKYEEAGLKIRKNALDALDKEAGKTQTLAEFRKSFVDEKLKEAAKEKSVDVEKLRLNTDLTKLLEKQADIEFKKNQKKPTANLDPNNIAKSQLASDLSDIKSSADAQVKAYADGQKIMEALRSAGLVDERDYYESKKQFITLENQTKEDALQQEINRLSQEKLIGKDKIDNSKKIAEATDKLEKVRAESATEMLLLSIQEEGAGKKLAQYYRDAEDAAVSYLDTLRKAQSTELAGMGLGNSERSRLSGRAQIEDKYSQQRQSLEKSRRDAEFNKTFGTDEQDKYNAELERIKRFSSIALSEYDTYYAERIKQEGDWTTGASEAYANYQEEIKNVAKSTEDMFSKAFKGMEDALVSFVKTGKLDFASLADSIITDLIRIQIQQSVMPGLSAGLNAGASWVASLFSANGNAFDTSGQVQKFAKGGTFTNQIVDQPTPFKFAKGTGIMGEAGPEAIMPLTRGSDGKLGVQASGNTSGNSIIVNVIESPGNGGQQSRRTENGVDILDVFVEKVKSSIATDINRGSGAVPNAMASTYGLNRVAGAY